MLLFMLLFQEAVVTFTSISSSVFIHIHHKHLVLGKTPHNFVT